MPTSFTKCLRAGQSNLDDHNDYDDDDAFVSFIDLRHLIGETKN